MTASWGRFGSELPGIFRDFVSGVLVPEDDQFWQGTTEQAQNIKIVLYQADSKMGSVLYLYFKHR